MFDRKNFLLSLFASCLLPSLVSTGAVAQETDVTFHRDIEPILQRSCQNCHRVGGVAPMPLVTYDQVAPFAGTGPDQPRRRRPPSRRARPP